MQFDHVDGVPFRSKEASWLAFNSRVLQEAADPSVPLQERIKFLGIYSSNLDEFFRVRVATLKRLTLLGKNLQKLNLPDPRRTLQQVKRIVRTEAGEFNAVYEQVLHSLKKRGVRVIDETQVPRELRGWLMNFFQTRVRPRIMPTLIRHYSRLSDLRDHPMYLAVRLSQSENSIRSTHALIEIPSGELPRFVVLPQHKKKNLVMYLDDIIRFGLSTLFAGLPYDRFEAWAVKFTRDAEMEFDDDITASLHDKIAEGLKARETGAAVRMNYDKALPRDFLRLLLSKLKLKEEDTLFPGARYHNRKDLLQFPKLCGAKDSDPPEPPLPHPRLNKPGKSLLRVIQKHDLLLHLPYHSFTNFLDLLREASLDPLVQSIHMTQYRVARHSCVAKALVAAVRNGKDVTMLVEPHARFDERNNIDWASHYQEAGIKVILGVLNLKVHAKLCLITRMEGGEPAFYSVIGTGNFNEDTATLYTDHLFMTSDQGIGKDLAQIFTFFTNTYQAPRLNYLVASPFHLRHAIKFWIQNEMVNAQKGRPAEILLKLNNLSDLEMVRQLGKAAEAGVKIRIIARSMFSVVTGDATHPCNIEAISIVDRRLEHSRIFSFANGGQPKIFLSSADFLPRNFDSRFEILCPIYDKKLQGELREYLEIQWRDNQKARVLDRTLANRYSPGRGKKKFRAQQEIRKWLAARLGGDKEA
ncbi:MAG: polyphosphate kinase 1 [Verrucomicrobiales bacterium]|nr:polyphosphate kinase 1 [Verrucomicrobiales bacterium]